MELDHSSKQKTNMNEQIEQWKSKSQVAEQDARIAREQLQELRSETQEVRNNSRRYLIYWFEIFIVFG